MGADSAATHFVGPKGLLLSASSLLLLWNVIGIDHSAFDGVLKPLAAVPREAVPGVLGLVVCYQTFQFFYRGPAPEVRGVDGFWAGADRALTYVIAMSAVSSMFMGIRGAELWRAVQQALPCLVFASLGWMLIIPAAYALRTTTTVVLENTGLRMISLSMVLLGALAVMVAASIARNIWPVWTGSVVGFLPGILIARAWRARPAQHDYITDD